MLLLGKRFGATRHKSILTHCGNAAGRGSLRQVGDQQPLGILGGIHASGLRLGTPAATTRGFMEPEIRKVTGWIADILDAGGSDASIERVRPQVIELCGRFPVYGD